MLTAIGPGVSALLDYTPWTDYTTQVVTAAQGDVRDTYRCTIRDLLGKFTIADEDEIVACDEQDPNGWPACNLLANPALSAFSGNTPTSWNVNTSPNGTGVTLGPAGVSGRFGASNCASVALANASNQAGNVYGIWQQITLPADENGTPLGLGTARPSTLPYAASVYFQVSAAVTAVTGQLRLEWWSANRGSNIRTDSVALNLTGQVVGTWQRAGLTAYPPANAALAVVSLYLSTTAATNSGTVRLSCAQLEYATFGAVQSVGFAPLLYNAAMGYHGTGGVVDEWLPDTNGNTDVTYAVVSSSLSSGTAQQITIASTYTKDGYTRGIQGYFNSGGTLVDPLQPIQLSMRYRVTTALSGGLNARIKCYCFTSNFTYLTQFQADGPTNEGATGAGLWQTLAFAMGPGTPNPYPAGTQYIKIVAGVQPPGGGGTASGGGVLAVGQISLAALGSPYVPHAATALASGQYPTPYVDASLAGCNVDRGKSGLAYRQMRHFGGFIRAATADYDQTGGPEAKLEIEAVDYGVMLEEAPANLLLNPQQDTAAISQVVAYAQGQGPFLVGIDATTYVSNLGYYNGGLFPWQTVKDVLNNIANNMAGTYWVDPYKFLHYQSALANNAPFALSDQPDLVATFPFSKFKYRKDSTQTLTRPVVEGSTTLSAPQSWPANGAGYAVVGNVGGTTATLSGNIAAGVSALPVSSGGTSFAAGSKIVVGVNTANEETVTVAGSGSTSTSVAITGTTANAHSSGDVVGAIVVASGANVTSLALAAATANWVRQGTMLWVSRNGQGEEFTVSADAAGGATSLSIQSNPAFFDIPAGAKVQTMGAVVSYNGGNVIPIAQVDSFTVAGAGLTIGAKNSNTYAQGYGALYDPTAGTVEINGANWPTNGQQLAAVFRMYTPVLIRVRSPAQEGAIQRAIHKHYKIDEVFTQQGAIDRANAELSKSGKPQPMGTARVTSPPWPAATPPRPLQAIPVTFAAAKLSGALFQIQKVETRPLGFGGVAYTLDIGFYHPDFIIRMAQAATDLARQGTNVTPGSVIQDVTSVQDGWAVSDGLQVAQSTRGVWGGSSTWGGSSAWG